MNDVETLVERQLKKILKPKLDPFSVINPLSLNPEAFDEFLRYFICLFFELLLFRIFVFKFYFYCFFATLRCFCHTVNSLFLFSRLLKIFQMSKFCESSALNKF